MQLEENQEPNFYELASNAVIEFLCGDVLASDFYAEIFSKVYALGKSSVRPDEWQPIETAPREDYRRVLVAFVETTNRKRPREAFVGEAEYRNGVWWFPDDYQADNGCIDPQPTHWMPLPVPPRSALRDVRQ